MMKRENGQVIINISEDEFAILLLALGFAIGSTKSWTQKRIWFLLANSINEGNPNWTPYR
jgi:hypothetical protein